MLTIPSKYNISMSTYLYLLFSVYEHNRYTRYTQEFDNYKKSRTLYATIDWNIW